MARLAAGPRRVGTAGRTRGKNGPRAPAFDHYRLSHAASDGYPTSNVHSYAFGPLAGTVQDVGTTPVRGRAVWGVEPAGDGTVIARTLDDQEHPRRVAESLEVVDSSDYDDSETGLDPFDPSLPTTAAQPELVQAVLVGDPWGEYRASPRRAEGLPDDDPATTAYPDLSPCGRSVWEDLVNGVEHRESAGAGGDHCLDRHVGSGLKFRQFGAFRETRQ